MSCDDHHPSSLRNREPIVNALLKLNLPAASNAPYALEIASGTGAHVEVCAPAFPALTWQPTEYCGPDSEVHWLDRTAQPTLALIDRHGRAQFPNVLPALHLNAANPFSEWPPEVQGKAGQHALVFCVNVTHITPWEVTQGLIRGAAQALASQGILAIYGPFKVDGSFTTESNREFDAALQKRNAQWGYRDVSAVEAFANTHGLRLQGNRPMPANNQLLTFIKLE